MRPDAHAAVIALYLLLALAFTFPLALHLFDAVPGAGLWNDSFAFMWNLWWAKSSLLSLHSPFFTDFILYPRGEYFYLGTLSILNGIISIPLQLALGVVGAYNILVIFYLVLGAYGTFLLSRHFVKDGAAAFLSGLIFGFSPYASIHMLHGHLNLLSAAWLPLFALFFISSFEGKGWRNPIAAGILLAVIGLTDWQVLMYALMLAAALGAARLWAFRGKNSGRDFSRAAAGVALGCALLSPLALAALAEAISAEHALPSQAERLLLSLDPVELVAIPQFGMLLRAVAALKGTVAASSWTENVGYLGLAALSASLIALFNVRKREVRWWALVGAAFIILSFGPVLHVFGVSTGIPLPAALLQLLPGASMVRVSSRFIVLTMLAVSVLAAYGFLFFSSGAKGRKGLFAGAAAFLIILELIPAPIALNSTEAVPAFYNSLAAEPGEFAVLEVPPMASDDAGGTYIQVYSYYQTIHGKRRVDGGANVASARMYDFLANTAFISGFCGPRMPDILEQEPGFESDLLAHYNIRYIILHRNFFDAGASAYYDAMLGSTLGQPAYDDGFTAAYRAGEPSGRPFATLAEGWSPRRPGGWGVVRDFDGKATMALVSPSPHTFRLRFEGWVEEPQVIRLIADGREVKSVEADGWFDFEADVEMQGGEAELALESDGGVFITRIEAR